MESEDLFVLPEPDASEKDEPSEDAGLTPGNTMADNPPPEFPDPETPQPDAQTPDAQTPDAQAPDTQTSDAPEPVQQEKKERGKAGRKLSRLAFSLLMLIIKLAIVTLTVFVLISYVFGVTRNQSLNMQPAVQDGDLLFYYRIVDDYAADDIVIVHYEDKQIVSRIVAVAGDTVDIQAEGLLINGALVQEAKAIGETTSFVDAVTFPLTVPDGEVFVLGDNRPNATDSRIFGCVRIADIDGRLVGLFRRRNF